MALSPQFSSLHKKESEAAPEDAPREKIPAASKQAVDFLLLIGTNELKPCIFEESLVAISETGQTIGTFSISVQAVCYSPDGWEEDQEDCFLVHANSKGTIDGVPCTTSITGYVTKRLETLEQHTQESIRFRDHPMETRTHVVKRQEHLFVRKAIVERDEEIHVASFSYKLTKLPGLVSESANLLLLRVMARRQSVPQKATFLSFDNDHHICTSTYSALGFQKQQVGKEEVDVFVIERAVHSVTDVPLAWQFYFLSDGMEKLVLEASDTVAASFLGASEHLKDICTVSGHLSRRIQVGSPAIMVILKMPILIDTDEPDPRPTFDKKPLEWEEDVELYSQFLDKKASWSCAITTSCGKELKIKDNLAGGFPHIVHMMRKAKLHMTLEEELQASHATYVRRHPELSALLADFLQLLLLRKPDDVVTFAAEFFAPFSAQCPPGRSFRSSDKPSPFRSHT